MSSQSNERIKFASTMLKELYLQLQQHSKETDIPLSKLFDRAIKQYLESNKSID